LGERDAPRGAARAARIAYQHIAEFPELANALKCDFPTLPHVPTFQYLATVLAERGATDEAIAVCRQAIQFGLADGTKGGFEGRIARIQQAAKNPNRRQLAAAREPPDLTRPATGLKSASKSFTIGFKVAGVSHDGRQEVIRKYLLDGDPLFFAREPENVYDPNAIQVRLANGLQIGYVPKGKNIRSYEEEPAATNADLARLLDAKAEYEARCWHILRSDEGPTLGVFLVGHVGQARD
jgi:hypothetical protein